MRSSSRLTSSVVITYPDGLSVKSSSTPSDMQYSSGIVSGPPAVGTMCLRASRWVPT